MKDESVNSMTAYILDSHDLYDYVTGIQYLNYMYDMFSVPVKERVSRIQNYGDILKLTNSLWDLTSSFSHVLRHHNLFLWFKMVQICFYIGSGNNKL